VNLKLTSTIIHLFLREEALEKVVTEKIMTKATKYLKLSKKSKIQAKLLGAWYLQVQFWSMI
jgi:hypothetical protein